MTGPGTATATEWQDYSTRSHEQVIKDLNAAHSRIRLLLLAADRKDKMILELKASIAHQKLMLWIQGAALTACWGLVLKLLFR
jgi:hypothetical protein